MVPTKKKPHLVSKEKSRFVPKIPQQIPKSPQKRTKKNPKSTENPIDLVGKDPSKSNMHQQKHPFYQKNLPSPCMLHLWTVVKSQLGCPLLY